MYNTCVGKLLELDGKKFGKLIATSEMKKDGKEYKRKCLCDCGNVTWVPTCRLTGGHTKSCGCFREEFRKLSPGQSAKNDVLYGYKAAAEKRELVWNITEKEFSILTKGDCHYCGIKPSRTRVNKRKNGNYIYNGIDRVDNSIGYISENVVSCCSDCNWGKNDMTISEFLSWIEKLWIKNQKC